MEKAIYQAGSSEGSAKHPLVRSACPWLHLKARLELRVGCSTAQPQMDQGETAEGQAQDLWVERESILHPSAPGMGLLSPLQLRGW